MLKICMYNPLVSVAETSGHIVWSPTGAIPCLAYKVCTKDFDRQLTSFLQVQIHLCCLVTVGSSRLPCIDKPKKEHLSRNRAL